VTVGGFMFWGLFLALAAILAGYVAWLIAVERGNPRDGRSPDAAIEPARPAISRSPPPPATSPDDGA
jgi:hypothetical protein